jgi:hypothetical protein
MSIEALDGPVSAYEQAAATLRFHARILTLTAMGEGRESPEADAIRLLLDVLASHWHIKPNYSQVADATRTIEQLCSDAARAHLAKNFSDLKTAERTLTHDMIAVIRALAMPRRILIAAAEAGLAAETSEAEAQDPQPLAKPLYVPPSPVLWGVKEES